MTDIRRVSTTGAPAAIGPYSQAVIAGDLVYCSGQIALLPASGDIVGADASSQTTQVLNNLEAVLAAAGSDLAHVLKVTLYLTDLSDFESVNALYGRRFGEHRPARATVGITSLPKGARVEIDCIAHRIVP